MNSIVLIWTAVLFSIAPLAPQDRLSRIATVVTNTTPDLEEQALLLTVSFYETTLGMQGIPFGATGRHAAIERDRRSTRRGPMREEEGARSVLNILRRARSMCPRAGHAAILGYFHHGRGCVSDGYSRSEARTAERLLRRAGRYMEVLRTEQR